MADKVNKYFSIQANIVNTKRRSSKPIFFPNVGKYGPENCEYEHFSHN